MPLSVRYASTRIHPPSSGRSQRPVFLTWSSPLKPFDCYLLLPRLGGAFDLRLAVSVPLPIVMGIFVLLWFQSRLT